MADITEDDVEENEDVDFTNTSVKGMVGYAVLSVAVAYILGNLLLWALTH